jgi:hypothetical protein
MHLRSIQLMYAQLTRLLARLFRAYGTIRAYAYGVADTHSCLTLL